MKKSTIIKHLEALRLRSAWLRGVRVYALELLEDYEGEDLPENWEALKKDFLNGAENWKEFSWGGCSLIYNQDIAERLCTPSELKKTRNGARKPNAKEEWLDTQARALYQASNMIYRAMQ